jgi:hypothetical protein
VLAEQLRSGTLFERELMNRDFVGRRVAEHNARRTDWTDVLWPVLALGLWADRFWASNGG